jgi:hypothetical protein
LHINTYTLVSAPNWRNVRKRKTTVKISDGDMVTTYRRVNLWVLGHLRIYSDGRIEYSRGKYVNNRAFTIRRSRRQSASASS